MWAAIVKGDVKEVKQYLALGEDVNLRGLGNMTPLHQAAQDGGKEMVELLIENGADANAITDSGKTPLDCAIKNRHVKLYPQIRKHGGKTAEELKADGMDEYDIDETLDKMSIDEIVKEIENIKTPEEAILSEDENILYVVSFDLSEVYVYDAVTLEKKSTSYETGNKPIGVMPVGNKLYVSNYGDNSISIINNQ